MSAPALPTIGQDPWGDQLNAVLDDLRVRVVTLEGQPNGAVMAFNFAPGGAAARSSFSLGQVAFDTTDQIAATSLLVSTTTATGASASLALQSVVPGTVLVLQQSDDVKQYALAIVSGDPVDNGDHFATPISSLSLAALPLLAGPVGLSAAGISGSTAALEAQVETNTAAITDLQARVAVLEGQPPPVTGGPTVTAVTPNNGPVTGGTRVTVTGTGFVSSDAIQVALSTGISNWWIMDSFVVVDDSTITAVTAATTDGPGIYEVAVYFGGLEATILTNAFTYT